MEDIDKRVNGKSFKFLSSKKIKVEVKEQIIGFSPTKSDEPKAPEPKPLKLQSDIKILTKENKNI